MRKYEGREMVTRSRFIEHVRKMSSEDRERLYVRVDQLISENPEFCDQRNHQHLCNIFTAMALYELLQKDRRAKQIAVPLDLHSGSVCSSHNHYQTR